MAAVDRIIGAGDVFRHRAGDALIARASAEIGKDIGRADIEIEQRVEHRAGLCLTRGLADRQRRIAFGAALVVDQVALDLNPHAVAEGVTDIERALIAGLEIGRDRRMQDTRRTAVGLAQHALIFQQ